jgi:hypothetical protein
VNPLFLGAVFDMGGKLLDKFFPDPAERAQKQMELLAMQQSGEFKVLETRMSAILAEANSTDPWTSRARPSFLYVFYAIILGMTVVAPVFGVFNPVAMAVFYDNVGKGFAAIPEEMWWTFTAGYLGYAGARTFEKRKGVAS